MPLICACHQGCPQYGNVRPALCPARIARRWQRLSPRAEQKYAQQAVAKNVPTLAEVEVQVLESRVINFEKEMQQRIQDTARIVRRKPRGGFNRNDDQPQDCGDPRFQNLMTIVAQSIWMSRFTFWLRASKASTQSRTWIEWDIGNGIAEQSPAQPIRSHSSALRA